MRKTFCDVCGEEVQYGDLHKLTIESRVFISAFEPGSSGPHIKTITEKELCPEHARLINEFIDKLIPRQNNEL